MNKHDRTSAVAVGLALAATALAFWIGSSGLPEGWSQFLSVGLPAWIQAVGTVAALVVAYRAYSTWRLQDDVKRKALAAEKFVTSARLLVLTINRTRLIRFDKRKRISQIELNALIELISRNEENLEMRNETLRAYEAVAERYLGPEIGVHVAYLDMRVSELSHSINVLRIGRRMIDSDQEWDRKMTDALASMGWHLGKEPKPNLLEDEFAREVARTMQHIEQAAAPFLVAS
ncbi:hypothetical protein ACO2I3_21710 [Leptospira interrogans]